MVYTKKAWQDGTVENPGTAILAADLDRIEQAHVDGDLTNPSSPGSLAVASKIDTSSSVTGKVAKGALLLNVKDYGAKGDGVTDDTAAIQAALNAGSVMGGAEVFLPTSGDYCISSTLTQHSRVTLFGVRGKSRLKVIGTQTTAISLAYKDFPSVRNIDIDCNNSTTLNTGILVTGGKGLHVSGVNFLNGGKLDSSFVTLSAAADVTITDCECTSGRRGIVGLPGSKRIKIIRVRFSFMAQHGILVTSSAAQPTFDITVEGCDFWEIIGGSPRYPLQITANDSVGSEGRFIERVRVVGNTFIGNYASYNSGTGTADTIGVYNWSNSEVANNTILGGGDIGIALAHSRRVTVSGNVVGDCNVNGISLWGSDYCTVVGNVCYNNRRNFSSDLVGPRGGIRVNLNGSNNLITGNRCYDDQATKTQDYGVFIEAGSNNNLVTANHLMGNLTGGLLDQGENNVTTGNLL